MPFGVDFGTTNSSVAWSDSGGTVHSLKVRRGPKEPFDAVERSLVFDPLGDSPIVGHLAEGVEGVSTASPLVSSAKRRFDKARLRQSRYEVDSTATGEYDPVNQCIKFKNTGRIVPVYYDEYSLDEVSAAAGLIFERLLTSTEIDVDPSPAAPGHRSVLSRLLGREGGKTTLIDSPTGEIDAGQDERLFVGVPVSFGPTARRRLLRSLVASGCFGRSPGAYREVLARCRLVYEPLALVTTMTLLESQDVLVFDYGGGTLDLALLRVELDARGMRVRERALGGLPTAGDRLDELFREYLLGRRPRLRRSYEQQVAAGSADRFRAESVFSRAKRDLSTNDSTTMRLFGDAEVTRAELEEAIGGELDRAVGAVHDTLDRGGVRAVDVGSVLLTGGSSLIPALQDRMREVFNHLADDLAFDAGTPGDVESERRALTGVSRGLALWGYRESFESSAPCDFAVVIPDTPSTRTVCLERGSSDVYELDKAPAVRIPVGPARRSIVLYCDLLRETYCGAIADVDLPDGEIEVRVSAHRDRFSPAFIVRGPRRKVLGKFDLEGMSAGDLQAWAEGDCEWMPLDRKRPESSFLTRPLEDGDFVAWRVNGASRQGKIVDIRDIASGRYVSPIPGFDPEPYVIRVAAEQNGRVKLGHVTSGSWRIGDVRLV
jgi:hypothetical protein